MATSQLNTHRAIEAPFNSSNMSNRIIYNSSNMSTALLLYLILCEMNLTIAWSPSSSSATSQRKPPFNGSIFGKRSTLPANRGLLEDHLMAIPPQPPGLRAGRLESEDVNYSTSLMEQLNSSSIQRCLRDYHKYISRASQGEYCPRRRSVDRRIGASLTELPHLESTTTGTLFDEVRFCTKLFLANSRAQGQLSNLWKLLALGSSQD